MCLWDSHFILILCYRKLSLSKLSLHLVFLFMFYSWGKEQLHIHIDVAFTTDVSYYISTKLLQFQFAFLSYFVVLCLSSLYESIYSGVETDLRLNLVRILNHCHLHPWSDFTQKEKEKKEDDKTANSEWGKAATVFILKCFSIFAKKKKRTDDEDKTAYSEWGKAATVLILKCFSFCLWFFFILFCGLFFSISWVIGWMFESIEKNLLLLIVMFPDVHKALLLSLCLLCMLIWPAANAPQEC